MSEDTALRLHDAVAAVCPIDGVAVGNPADKTTWRIDYAAGATGTQKAEAAAAVAAFDLAAASPLLTAQEFLARFTQQEQQAIWAAAAKDVTGVLGAGLTQGQVLGTVDLTSPVLKEWMAALVVAGALTADRATKIETP